MKWVALFLILFSTASAEIVTVDIQHPGAGGLNNFYQDRLLSINEARELLNLDIQNGELVKRPGFARVYASDDSTCDGIAVYYNLDGKGRLLKVVKDNDSVFGIIKWSNDQTYTFASDSVLKTFQFLHPFYGYDWFQWQDVLIGAADGSHPVVFRPGNWTTISMPSPGAPMVAVNKYHQPADTIGDVNGTYAYKMVYLSGTDTAYTKRSKPGRQSAYVFPRNQSVLLFNFPERPFCSGYNIIGGTTKAMLLRNKDKTEKFYVVDTFTYTNGEVFVYIDTKTDAQLGDYVPDTLGSDTIPAPGAPIRCGGGTPGMLPYSSAYLPFANDSPFYWAVSYIDTLLKIESPLGMYYKDDTTPNDGGLGYGHDSSRYIGIMEGFSDASTSFYEKFYDGVIFYYSRGTDTSVWNCAETVFTVANGRYQFHNAFVRDSWTEDTLIPPWRITNQIPYPYLLFAYNRLWGAGDADFPSRLYYSDRTDTGSIGSWDMVFDYLALDENDGDKIIGLTTDGNTIGVYKGYSIWMVTGTDPNYDMQAQKVSQGIGAVSNRTIVTYRGVDFFLSPAGKIYQRSGGNIVQISQKIDSSFNSLSLLTLSKARAFEYGNEIWFVINDTSFIYSLDNQLWRKYGFAPQYTFSYDTSTVNNSMLIRDRILHFTRDIYDTVFAFDYGDTCSTDAGTVIPVRYKSPAFLTDGYYKPIGGYLEMEIPTNSSAYFYLLSLTGDTLSKVVLNNPNPAVPSIHKRIDNIYEFSLDSDVSSGYYVYITDAVGCRTFRLKRIVLNFNRYAR